MDKQTELFQPPAPPPPADSQDEPIAWIVEALEPAALEIIQTDPDTGSFHPEDQKRIAAALAKTLAEKAEQELVMIAMVNGCPPFDDPDRGVD